VLFDRHDQPKIIDLGLACMLESKSRVLTIEGAVGTNLYMSPEKGSGRSYDDKDDVWALGCMLAGGVIGKLLEDTGLNTMGIFALHRPNIDRLVADATTASARLGTIVSMMLAQDPRRRLTAEQAVEALRVGGMALPDRLSDRSTMPDRHSPVSISERSMSPTEAEASALLQPRLPPPHDKVVPSFVAHERVVLSECRGKRSCRRVTGKGWLNGGLWSALTDASLGDRDVSVTFRLVELRGEFACFGVIHPSAMIRAYLGKQNGGVGLWSKGEFWVNGTMVKNFLPTISEDSVVTVGWRASSNQLAWWIDGKQVFEHFGDFASHSFAVSGFQDMAAFEIESDRRGFKEKSITALQAMGIAPPLLCCKVSYSQA